MRVKDQNYRTIWQKQNDKEIIQIIDQRLLPQEFIINDLLTYQDAIESIQDLAVRGAPLIGGTAAWGVYLAAVQAKKNDLGIPFILDACKELVLARPTATNLKWSIDRILKAIEGLDNLEEILNKVEKEAIDISNEDLKNSENNDKHGLE